MADLSDWREVEQVLADGARLQGFVVSHDASGRLVLEIDEGDGGKVLNLEVLAHEVASHASRPR